MWCKTATAPTALSLAMLLTLSGCTDDGGGSEPEPCPPVPKPGDPLFIDATAELGIDVVHHMATDFCKLSDNIGGPGVCVLDYDNDDDLDLYFVDRAPYPNKLYRNDGGFFSDVSTMSGAGLESDTMGCLAFDYDGDEDVDLYLTNLGPDQLLRNDGGVFVDVTDEMGIEADSFSITATAGDMDNDGDLDLFVARTVVLETCPDFCYVAPLYCQEEPNLLFENRGDRFVEVSVARGLTRPAPTLTTLFTDFNVDGHLDLYVGNDMGVEFPDHLYINDGSANFQDVADARSMDAPGTCTMGVDVGDYDLDGHLDMVITDFEDRPIRLFRCYDPERPCSNEVVPDGKSAVKFGVNFVDFDNDRDLDLFTANGDIESVDGDRNFLYFNDGSGDYTEHIPADDDPLAARFVSRGLAFGDLDGDGDIDIALTNVGAAPQVLLNQAAAGHSLFVALDSNAVGAQVKVTSASGSITEHAVIGGSYAGNSDPRLHFGLGQDCRADIAVTYLGGETRSVTDARAGEVVRIER